MTEHEALLLCDDLIFSSRIKGTAKAIGLTLRTAKTVHELRGFLAHSTPRCVILDLNAPGLTIDEFAAELAAMRPRPTLVGYGSHVDTATLKQARDAGLDVVWPRSKFVEELEASLPVWCGPREMTP